MRHIDITVDIEALALSTNAAILQIAAIAWDREHPTSPFVDFFPFEQYVDIRSCVIDKFDFEPCTIKWWGEQKPETKEAVLTPPAQPLKDVLDAFCDWIKEMKEDQQADTVCLWAQGSDYDIANLRNAFARYGIAFPVDYIYFRDARTFILEVGAYMLIPDNPISGITDVDQIYSKIPNSDSISRDAHNAVSDVCQTTWNVYQLLQRLHKTSRIEKSSAEAVNLDSRAVG